MLRTVAGTSVALTAAIALLVGAAVLALGGGPGEAAAWAVVLVLGSRIVPILASFPVAYRPRGAHRVPPLKGAALVRIAAAESWALVKLYFFYHPLESCLIRRDPPRIAEGELPIVLVHGFYANAGFWHCLTPHLDAAGWRNVFSLSLEPPFASIDDYARQLAHRVEEVCARCRVDAALIVAHSMGGLVARACARREPGRIAHIVCLGTPHEGTVLASLVPLVTTRQMRRGSDWLSQLNSHPPGAPPVVNIYSEHDNIIVPQTSAAPPGAANESLHGIGHLEMAFSPVLRDKLLEVLAQLKSDSSTRPPLP